MIRGRTALLRAAVRLECLEARVLFAAEPLDVPLDSFDVIDDTFDYSGLIDANTLVTTTAKQLSDGSLLIGGYDTAGDNPYAFVTKFGPDGARDPGFNGGSINYLSASGYLSDGVTYIDGAASKVLDLAVAPDGSIWVAGATGLEGSSDLSDPSAVSHRFKMHLAADGSVDLGFGVDGVEISTPTPTEIDAVAIDNSGAPIFAGIGYDPENSRYFATLAKRFADGSIDTSFGYEQGGSTIIVPDGDLLNAKMAFSPDDGSIFVAGSVRDSNTSGESTFVMGVTKYTSDGFLDSSFGGGGLARIDFDYGDDERAADLVLQPDGKIVVVGTARDKTFLDTDFAIARLNPDGTLDQTFGTDGKATVTIVGTSNDQAQSVGLQPDGQICVGGISDGKPALAALLPDGSVDYDFGDFGHYVDDTTILSAFSLRATLAETILLKCHGDGRATFSRSAHDNTGDRGTTSISRVVFDHDAPVATLGTIADLTAADPNARQITVVYTDNIRIEGSTIDGSDLLVTGPGGFSANAAVLSKVPTDAGKTYTVVYGINAPDGAWDSADNGLYTVSLVDSQVNDPAGLFAVGTSANFSINIGAAVSVAPTAVLSSSPPVTEAGGSTASFTVTYADDSQVSAGSVAAGNLTLTRADGSSLSVNTVTTVATNGGATLTATYVVKAPGGAWDAQDSGVYTIALLGNQVSDDEGNFVEAKSLGTFNVNVPVVNGPPTATLSAVPATVNTSGGTGITFTVNYAASDSVDASSITVGDVTVIGPNGPLTITSVAKTGGGKSLSATYSATAPGGAWGIEDNGVYTIAVVAGQVFGASGKSAAAASLGNFSVAIVAAPPVTRTAPDGALAGRLSLTAPASVISGLKAKLKGKIILTNQSGADVNGTAVVRLYLSTDAYPDATDALLTTLTKSVKLKTTKSKSLGLKFGAIPAMADGNYQFVAVVVGIDGAESAWAAGPAIVVAAPFVDLEVRSPVLSATSLFRLAKTNVSFRVANLGNIPAKLTLNLTLKGALAGSALQDIDAAAVKLNLSAGKDKSYKAKFIIPGNLAIGTYSVALTLDGGGLADRSLLNNTILAGQIAVFG